MSDERVHLTFEAAMKMLPEGKDIHTFRNSVPGLVFGCDSDRGDLIEKIKKHGAELSGEQATAMNHGMVLFDERGPLFIETIAPPIED